MNISETPHTKVSGLVVTSLNNADVNLLSKNYLLSQLSEYGYLVLRDFKHSIESFANLVKKSSGKISLDPARSFSGDTAQKVDAGFDKVGLHCENGNSPFWPDLCWFYCQQAPIQGSQTTVCDGKLVYQHLSSDIRDAFSSQDIVYTRRVDEHKWKTYAFHALGSQGNAPGSIDETTLEHLLSLTSGSESTRITLEDDGAIYYSFQTPAIRGSRLNPEERHNFANSIFGPSNHYEKPVITFVNGENIPLHLLEEVDSVCDRFTFDIGWQSGDIVLIDNKRVMHGRRRIEDKSRTIFNALSYLA